MSVQLAVSQILPSVPILDDTNWFAFEKRAKMFFAGCGHPGIASGKAPTDADAKAAYERDDAMLVAYLAMRVSNPYLYLVEDEISASAAYAKLKAHFQKPTVGHRMAARKEFYDTVHDPALPIDQYIQAVKAGSAKLSAFGVTIADTELVDVLLMGLHDSWNGIRSSILMAKTDPTSAEVINSLTGSAAATETISIKVEDTATGISEVLAARVQHAGRTGWQSGARRGASGSGSGGSPFQGRVDSKGYTWCDTTLLDACHRCGRSGHIASRCMFDMPSHIKDWVMSLASRSRSPSPPSRPRHSARSAHVQPTFHPYAGATYVHSVDDADEVDEGPSRSHGRGGVSPLLI